MDIPTLLSISRRQIPDEPKRLLTLAARQLSLTNTALNIHLASDAPEHVTASTTGVGIHQVRGIGGEYSQPVSLDEILALANAMTAGTDRAEVSGRSFVYELAVLKKMVEGAARSSPDASTAGRRIAEFEGACPNLINIRDSLAHLDERMLGRRYQSDINIEPAVVEGHHLDPGAFVQRGRLSVHMADGTLGDVRIAPDVVVAARSLIQGVADTLPEVSS